MLSISKKSSYSFPVPKRKVKLIRDWTVGSGSESDEDLENEDRFPRVNQGRGTFVAVMPDYWIILKALRMARIGDQATVASSLTIIASFDLSLDMNFSAVSEPDVLELFLNVAETNDFRCRLAALSILNQLSVDQRVSRQLIKLGLSETLVYNLYHSAVDINQLAARIIHNIGSTRMAARALRKCGVLEVLVKHLQMKKSKVILDYCDLIRDEKSYIELGKWVIFALFSLSKFSKNKIGMLKMGIVPELKNILLSGNKTLLTPAAGIVAQCCTIPVFQQYMSHEGLIGIFIIGLQSTDTELQCMSALALSRAAGGNEMVRKMIHFHHGPKVIVQFIKDIDRNNKPLVIAGISALWKSAISTENVTEFEKQDAVSMLSDFLAETHLDVLCVTVGAIAEMAKSKTARVDFINRGCMTAVINMLGHINEDLLVNAAYAVGVFANCDEGMEVMDKCDGLRLLWSLLMNSSRRVKVQALWAVKPYVARHPDSGEIIRSLMGSLTLLVKMLQQKDREVLAAVCAVISEVALDLENLAVMTEQGVVKRLATLITKEKRDSAIHKAEIEELRNIGGIRFEETNKRIVLFRELSSAIANCASLEDNRRAFGRAGIIPVLVGYLETKNSLLLAQACRALNALSKDNFNCVSIQSCGALPCLLTAIESRCMVTQVESTSTVRNIRNMLIRGEVKKIAFECLPRIESDKKRAEIEAIVKVLSGHRRPEDEKEALLKGTARPSTVTPSLSIKNIKRNKSAKIIWADTIKKKFAQKPEPIMSWRERMNLFSRTLKETKSSEKRPFETEIILKSKVATQKGRPVGSQTSSSHLHEEAVSELKAGTGI